MSENIQLPTPPVPPVTIANTHTQQTAENPSGAPIKEEVKTEVPAPEKTTEAAPVPKAEESKGL
jgi:hypothetical protein